MDRIAHAYVIVAGEPSDEADEGIAGFYRFKDGAPVDLLEGIALEAFHDGHGIEVLDDFEISVVGPGGNRLEGQRELKGERLLDWSTSRTLPGLERPAAPCPQRGHGACRVSPA